MTEFDKAMQLDNPMYSKEQSGLSTGTKNQFEKKYGKID